MLKGIVYPAARTEPLVRSQPQLLGCGPLAHLQSGPIGTSTTLTFKGKATTRNQRNQCLQPMSLEALDGWWTVAPLATLDG